MGILKRKKITSRYSFIKKKLKENLISTEEYENNASGFAVKITSWTMYNEKQKNEQRFYFSKWNAPDSIALAYGKNMKGKQYHKFDRYGNIIERKIRVSFPTGSERIDRFSYEPDAKGNRITRTTIIGNDAPKTEQRTITYWD